MTIHYKHYNIGPGQVTIAYSIGTQKSNRGPYNGIKIAAAFCSPKDSFNRKTGRKLAATRLKYRATRWHTTFPGEFTLRQLHENARMNFAGALEVMPYRPVWAVGKFTTRRKPKVTTTMWAKATKSEMAAWPASPANRVLKTFRDIMALGA